MVGDFQNATRFLVVGVFAAGGAVAEVVVVAQNGLQEGGPVLGGDELMPLVDLLVATERAELVEELAEIVGFVEKAGVVVEEELGPAGEGEADLGDGGGGEFFPQGGGKAAVTDAAGFGFDEDGLLGMEAFHGLVKGAFEEFLGRLGAEVAEKGAAVIGEGFEVEGLGPGLAEVFEETGFAGARESGENVKGGRGAGEAFFEVLQHEFAVALIPAFEHAGAPTDGAQDMGEGAGAQASPPAVEKGLVIAVPRFFQGDEVIGGILGDVAGAEDAAGEGASLVEGADFDPLLVGEDGEIDGPGEMVFGEFERSAHVDDAGELLEGEGEGNGFEILHRVEKLVPWNGRFANLSPLNKGTRRVRRLHRVPSLPCRRECLENQLGAGHVNLGPFRQDGGGLEAPTIEVVELFGGGAVSAGEGAEGDLLVDHHGRDGGWDFDFSFSNKIGLGLGKGSADHCGDRLGRRRSLLSDDRLGLGLGFRSGFGFGDSLGLGSGFGFAADGTLGLDFLSHRQLGRVETRIEAGELRNGETVLAGDGVRVSPALTV